MENGMQSETILDRISKAAIAEARKRNASIVLFDFLDKDDIQGWPSNFVSLKMPSPGTILKNRWQSLEDYLARHPRFASDGTAPGVRLLTTGNLARVDATAHILWAEAPRFAAA